MKKVIISFVLTFVLVAGYTLISYAVPDKGFYFGFNYGEAALNNDLYIYSDEASDRQPSLDIREHNAIEGMAYSIYGGYNFLNKEIDLLGTNPVLQLGVQGGYDNLGEYTLYVDWESTESEIGYRKIEENSIDLLLTSTLYWDNGFNLSGKVGIARLSGKIEDNNLPSIRQPEQPWNGEAMCVIYHPEITLGVGYLFNDKYNLYIQYSTIMADTPTDINLRFQETGGTQMPNTLYKVDKLTLGVNMYIF
jgi:hypothetical protein